MLKGRSGGNVISDREKANLLNSFFGSVYVHDDNVLPAFPSRVTDGEKLDYVHFSPDVLRKICKSLMPKLTSDSDEYPPFLLKKIVPTIS